MTGAPESLWLIPTPRQTRRRAGIAMIPSRIAAGPEISGALRERLTRVLQGAGVELALGAPPWIGARGVTSHSRGDEWHRLVISDRGVAIDHGPRGLRWALVTLGQLVRRFGRELPLVEIEDWPGTPTRGVMLDVSRNKVPTIASLLAALDRFEELKLNHLELYTEHTFAYAGHEDVWSSASPLTPAEIRELDFAARCRGIELSANQNCLGHLHRWLKLPRYAPLAEIPPHSPEWLFETDDGRTFPRSGPHSLCPVDPRSIALIEELLGQLLPCFTSPLVNIGCDEAYDVGQGRSRAAVAEAGGGTLGRTRLYLDYLRRVFAITRSHAKRPMFWADIALKKPELLGDIAREAVALTWGYEADTPFARWGDQLRSLGMEFWACPGTSSWCSFIGRTSVRRANLIAAAGGVNAGATGCLITDWGDRGHRQHWPVSLHSLAHGAHAAWRTDAPADFDPRASALHLFGDVTGALGPWLDELGDADAALRSSIQGGLRNQSAVWVEFHRRLRDVPRDTSTWGSMEHWQDVRLRLAELATRMGALTHLEPLVRRELGHTLAVALFACDKAVLCRACAQEPGDGLPRGAARVALAADLGSIIEEHCALWPERNRPGGLDESSRWYEDVLEDLERS